jgi:hypothetical protein
VDRQVILNGFTSSFYEKSFHAEGVLLLQLKDAGPDVFHKKKGTFLRIE